MGNNLYKELQPYFEVHGTYFNKTKPFARNNCFHYWDLETEPPSLLLELLKPDIIISALRGNFEAQINAHSDIARYVLQHNCKLIFLSSSNVFDAFTNFPSYEHDKTLSESIYGRFKIKIENMLMRLPEKNYIIARLPMVFGKKSPRIKEIKELVKLREPIEVFPNVVMNATSHEKLTQQIHFLINQDMEGIFHLGSNDLIHHHELIEDFCEELQLENPIYKRVYSSNEDRFLAVLPKDNILPKNLQINIKNIVKSSSLMF